MGRVIDRIERALDRASTCPACGHRGESPGCDCTDARCACAQD